MHNITCLVKFNSHPCGSSLPESADAQPSNTFYIVSQSKNRKSSDSDGYANYNIQGVEEGWLTFFLNLCYLGAKFNDPSWGGQRGTPYGSKGKISGREKRSYKNTINGGHFPCMAVLLQFIRVFFVLFFGGGGLVWVGLGNSISI